AISTSFCCPPESAPARSFRRSATSGKRSATASARRRTSGRSPSTWPPITRPQEATQRLQHRGFAGPVRPDEARHRPLLQREVEPAQDVAAAVAGDDALDPEQGGHPPK